MRQHYATDLTDDQWAAVRPVLGPGPAADGLRAAVDGMLYRNHARIPWSLLPPGFPPADDLRRRYDEWQGDGTWAAVRRALASHPAPRVRPDRPALARLRRAVRQWARRVPGGRAAARVGRRLVRLVAPDGLGGLRRRAARAARRVPGGAAALYPARWLIQLGQWAARPFTVHAKLPGWFALAHVRLFQDADFAAADDLLGRVLTYDPYNTEAWLRRAYARVRDDRPADALPDCWSALALPDLTGAQREMAHAVLSQAAVLAGELDLGVRHGELYRRLQQDGPAAAWWEDGPPAGPDGFELSLEAHKDLAEYAINTRADFPTAAALYHRADAVRAGYARWLAEVPARTLYLNEDWTRNIGHMALIDFWLKMQRLGWRTWDRVVLLTPPGRVANPAYVRYFGRHLDTLPLANVPPGLRHLITAFGPRVAGLLPVPGGDRYITEGMGLVQEAWEAAGHGPLLTLTPEDEAFGRARLRDMGVPDGAWFVSLHVRSAGFHKEGKQAHQAHRNAEIDDYLPAVREVVRRGGWVVRMGDPSMPPFPETPGVIDYARGKFKSPRMDVFLCGGCRFFLGVASGISHVPTTFGVPSVLTNWLSNAFPVYSRLDLFLPKLLRSVEEDRLLTIDEYLHPDTRLMCYSGEKLTDAGLEVVDNSPEDLRDVVAEMLDQLEAGAPTRPSAGVTAFDAIARKHGLVGFSRISRAFAARHAALLPGVAAEAGPVRAAA